MKITVYGYFGRGNLGDEALASVWEKRLSTLGLVRILSPPRFPRGEVVVFTGEPLQDRTSLHSLLFYAAAIRGAARCGHAILGAVGVDVHLWISRYLLPKILRDVDYISVRDPRSQMALSTLGIAAREARDAAFLLPAPIGHHNGPVLLNLVPSLPAVVQKEAWEFSRVVAGELGRKLHGLVMARGEDERALRGLEDTLVPRSVEEALELISGAALLIGARLHALEFALLCGTPFVAVPYAAKVESFLQLVERDLPEEIPRIPGEPPREVLELLTSASYIEGLARARGKIRREAEEGARDVVHLVREMA